MNGYENGKIYKVVDENGDIIYIGSTKLTLNVRWGKPHQLKCDENKIILIENYPCKSRKELQKYEQKFIDLYIEMGLLNKIKSYQTEEERKEYIKEYHQSDRCKELKKEYDKSDKRKEQKKKYSKQYNKIKANCPYCDKLMFKCNLSTHIKKACKNKPN